MSIPTLTYHPNSLLRATLLPVELSSLRSPEMQKMIDIMVETMFAKNGIGIAANQVGKNHQIAILNTAEGPVVIINPRITKRSILKESGEEGCLSVPGLFGMVKRHRSLTLSACDRHGKPFTMKARGLLARVIQHELDHLNGILCIDRISRVTQGIMPNGRKKV
ncbi:MAG: peptide deformylase [Parcubacteria group bacterium]